MGEADWIRIQRKTFTRWCNSHLVNRNIAITSLEDDLSDGTVLHSLLEELGGEQLPKVIKAPKTTFQKIQNLSYCFKYMQAQNIKLVGIGAEDIMNKNSKLVLGLIWTLILRFQISKAEFGDDPNAGPKKALLEWCNKVLNPQGVYVKDFTTSWQDGVAFCGLVNVLQPGEIDLSKLDRENEKLKNNNLAFDKAEELFQIARLLDAEDMVRSPDELSVMSYVSLFRAYLGAVTPAAEHCTAEGPGLTEAITKEKAFFTVITRNEEKELITRGGANVSGVVTGPDGKKIKCVVKDKLNGTYECYYIVNTPGDYVLEVFVAQKPIQGSPFHPVARANGPHALQCEAYGPGIEQVTAGVQTEFHIKAKDERGNELTEGGATFLSTFKDPAGDIAVSIADNNNGTYRATYTAKTAGKHNLIVLLKTDEGDLHIKDSPFTVIVLPGALSVSNCEISGSGLEVVVAGETGEFRATSKDDYGNIVTGCKMEVGVEGPESFDVHILDNGDGQYVASYVPTKAGNYKLFIKLDGSSLPNSPFNVEVVPASASAANTEAFGDGLHNAMAGEPNGFKVQVRDRFNNNVRHGGDPITATITLKEDPSVTGPAEVKDNGDGTYDITYPAIGKAGEYLVNIYLGEEHIKDSPHTLLVSPNSTTEPGNSYAVGVQDCRAGETQTVVIHTLDAFGNHLNTGGNKVSVKLSDTDEIVADVVDNGDGTYTATWTPTKAGDYTVDVTVNGESVKENPFKVTVSPSDVEPSHCIAEGPGLQRAKCAKDASFKVYLRDRFDNVITNTAGAVVTGTVTAEGQEPINVDVTDNGDGTFSCKYRLRRPGNWTLDVRVNDGAVKDNPFSLRVTPGAVYVPNTKVDPKDGIAGKPGTRIGLFDVEGNPRHKGGQKVRAALARPLTQEAHAIDNGDGTFDIVYPPDAKGEYEVKVYVGDEEAPGGSFKVTVGENEVDEDTKAAVESALPNSGATVNRLLRQATDEERAALLRDLEALKSGAPATTTPTPSAEDNARLADLEKENADLKRELEEARKLTASTENNAHELESLAKEKEQLENEKQQLESEKQQLENEKQQLENEKQQLAEENERLCQELAEAQQAASAATPVEDTAAKEELAKAQEENKDLEKKLEQMQEQYDSLVLAKEEADEKNRTLVEELEKLKAQLAALSAKPAAPEVEETNEKGTEKQEEKQEEKGKSKADKKKDKDDKKSKKTQDDKKHKKSSKDGKKEDEGKKKKK